MSQRARESLEPYAEAFEIVVLPYVWRHRRTETTDRHASSLARRLRQRLRTATGHPVHSALVCYAMRLCCHYHLLAVEAKGRARDIEVHRVLVDAAFGTIAKLEEYHGTYRLRLLLA